MQAAVSSSRKRRGCLFYVRRGLLSLVALIAVLIVVGVVYQSTATAADQQNYPPPGELVEVDGHLMHISCMGEGSPTVILEAGGISYSTEWYWVQRQLAATHRVCAYDRAGMGWSDVSPAPRDGVQIATELHTLLAAADIPAPYMLAGHSYGGIINRIYASQYPDDVLGIVLVDTAMLLPSSFPTQGDFDQWKRENDILQVVLWGMVRVGLYRLTINSEMHGYGYPDAIANELTALRSSNQAFDTYYAEGTLIRQVLTEQDNAAKNLGALPLMVLWATELPRTLSPEEAERYAALQAEVASYSSNSATLYMDGATHGSIIGSAVYAQQVTDAILAVIAAAQTGEPLPS